MDPTSYSSHIRLGTRPHRKINITPLFKRFKLRRSSMVFSDVFIRTFNCATKILVPQLQLKPYSHPSPR